MKSIVCIVSVVLLCSLIYSIEIPFSQTSVKTDANLFENFIRLEPEDKIPETLKTKCWIWHDEDFLHVEFATEIDSTFRTGSYNPKDYGAEADFIRIQLITIPQAYYAYAYYAYPMGNLVDAIRGTDMSFDSQWNSSYTYTTSFTDSLWTGQINIPFKELRFKSQPPYNWKVIFTTNHFKTEELYTLPWCNIKDGKDYFLEAADITLTHKIKASRDWKIKPYYVKSYDLVSKTQTFDPEHIGLDFSFNPGTKTKIKATVNPDYSDIPPDDASNNYNDRYPTMYWESRYFFTEDIDAFGVDYGYFYTRNIVQPRFAFKFTGNNEGLNYGVLGAWDKKITEDGDVTNRDDYYQIVSLIPSTRKVKLVNILLSRMNKDYYNHVPIVSLKWEFLPKVNLHTTFMGSFKEQNNIFTKGMTNSVSIEANPGNWELEVGYNNKLKDFAVDMGQVYYENYDSEYLSFVSTYRSETKDAYIRSWSASAWGGTGQKSPEGISLWYIDNKKGIIHHNAEFESNNLGCWGSLELKSKQSLFGHVSLSKTEYDNEHYQQNSLMLTYSNDKWDKFGFNLRYGASNNLVYRLYDTYGMESAGGGFWISFTKTLTTSFSLNNYDYYYQGFYNVVHNQDTTDVYLDNNYNIITASLSYNMNIKMSWRNGLSYSTYRTPNMYPDLTFYSNFEYEFKPDWFLYLGYRTGQMQTEPSSGMLIYDNFYRYSASAYLKVSATI